MHRLVIALVGALAAALLPAGCSGSVSSCPATFTPCGGDITGTWTFETACGQNAVVSAACPAATSTLGASATGSFTFASGKFTEILTVHDSGTVTLPASCVMALPSCATLDATENTSGLSIVSSGCTGTVTTGCTCTVAESGTVTLTGTYTTSGNNVIMTTAGTTTPGAPMPYCATASQLQLGEGTSSSAYAVFSK